MSIPVRPIYVALGLVPFLKTAQAFSYGVCKKAFDDLIAQNETIVNGKSVYFQLPNGSDNGSVTYDACKAVCEAGDNGIVSDCGPRLSSWVLPVVILAGSVQQPPLAFRQRVCAILRMAGDPIGSLLYMIQELRLYQYCLDEGTKTAAMLEHRLSLIDISKDGSVVTTVRPGQEKSPHLAANFARIFHAFSKTKPGHDPSDISQYFQKAISRMAKLKGKPSKRTRVLVGFRNQVNRSGREIIKEKNISTPLFAVVWFIVPLVVAIVPEVSPPASGGMIASILILPPLLSMVFLSNAIGEYSNLDSLERELKDVRTSIPKQIRQKFKNPLSVTISKTSTTTLQYMRRPTKRRPARTTGEPGVLRWTNLHWLDVILPLVLFSLAVASAGGAIGTAPTFFHERHIFLLIVFFAWVGSWGITYWGSVKDGAERLVAAVHCIVAISVPVLLAGMTCGVGGNCKTWTGYWWYGVENARFPRDLGIVFQRNVWLVYPTLASVCLGVNLVAFAVLRYLIFRVPFLIIAGDDSKIGAGEIAFDRGGEVELAELSEHRQEPGRHRTSDTPA
ncbi:hypothetical protein V8F06_011083 [Rhypophila decipiens]